MIEPTPLAGLLLITPKVFGDARGRFQETYNEQAFAAATGLRTRFVQDNESLSMAHVLRGLHFQATPHAQAKLVRVAKGSVLDVAVDIRPDSPTYGQHVKAVLDDREFRMFYIPEGFAHGFRTLEDGTIFTYKCSAYYQPSAERSILWNDPDLAIDWGVGDPLLSDKDRKGLAFAGGEWK